MELVASKITYSLSKEDLRELLAQKLDVPLACVSIAFKEGVMGRGGLMGEDVYETIGVEIYVDGLVKDSLLAPGKQPR